jgi:putative spermidine/putrescine transport system substrate-binding protein
MNKSTRNIGISRRTLIKAGALAGVSAPAVWSSGAFAQSSTITVRDPGGVWRKALTEAYYRPFEAATGVKINPVISEHDPSTLIKGQVDTKNVGWDVVVMTKAAQDALPVEQYFEKIDLSGPDVAELPPNARDPHWLGISVYATVLAYNTEKYKTPPASWSDFWDTAKFPGRRAMRKHPIDTFEATLLADGVAPDKVFPLDIARALRKLDQVKPAVNVWWTGGAQSTQLLKAGEVDLCVMWNARAQAAIDDGAKYALMWNRAIYGMDGLCIPKGAKGAGPAREFIKFCANAKRQGEYAKHIGYGPSNPTAFQYIAPERAKILPTDPSRFSTMVYQDPAGWGPVKDEAVERFDAWIIKS